MYLSNINVKSFNGSYYGQDTSTVGADHSCSYGCTNYIRVDYILGGKVQGLGINPEYTVNKDSYCQSMRTTVNWK
jgi:hypothetical protein